MKKITILVPEQAVLASIDDPRCIFEGVNDILRDQGREPIFEITLAGEKDAVQLHGGLFTVHTHKHINDIDHTDLIFMPAINGSMDQALDRNKNFYPWVCRQYAQGAEVASLCIGAFMLASTGLLNGKQCSTHWKYANDFRLRFPEVTMVDDRIITEENGLYSSGGANSYWNLLLYLVEKYTSREVAILASKIYAVEIERQSQSPFIMFNGQKGHEDAEIKAAQEYIEKNVTEKISVDELANRFAVGRRSFEKRFKKATNNTPVEYMQRVRIELAKRWLETTRKNVNEVMYDIGYADVKAFRSVFKKITGLSPVDYRNKYTRQVVA